MAIRNTSAHRPLTPNHSSASVADPDALPEGGSHLLPVGGSHLLPLLTHENGWRQATLQCLREGNFPLVKWLSEHLPNELGVSFEKRAPLVAVALPRRCMVEDYLKPSDMKILRLWMESEHCSGSVEINLCRQPLGHEYVDDLVAMLRTGAMTALNVSACDFGTDEFNTICRAMEENRSIVSLTSRCNPFRESAEAIASMLMRSPTLTELDVAYCKLGTEGVKQLAEAICVNQTLQALDITQNTRSASGLSVMADLLRRNTSLRRLILRDQPFPESNEFEDFCKALACNTSLKRLTLGDRPKLTKRGASRLSRAFEQNMTLEHLHLSYLGLGDEGNTSTSIVIDGLTRNRSLRSLRVDGIEFPQGPRDPLTALVAQENSCLTSLKVRGVEGKVPQSLVNAIRNNFKLTDFELTAFCIDGDAISPADLQGLHLVVERNRRLLTVAADAAHFMWSRSSCGVPPETASLMGSAFHAMADGATLNNVATAAFGDLWLPKG